MASSRPTWAKIKVQSHPGQTNQTLSQNKRLKGCKGRGRLGMKLLVECELRTAWFEQDVEPSEPGLWLTLKADRFLNLSLRAFTKISQAWALKNTYEAVIWRCQLTTPETWPFIISLGLHFGEDSKCFSIYYFPTPSIKQPASWKERTHWLSSSVGWLSSFQCLVT